MRIGNYEIELNLMQGIVRAIFLFISLMSFVKLYTYLFHQIGYHTNQPSNDLTINQLSTISVQLHMNFLLLSIIVSFIFAVLALGLKVEKN